MLRLINIPLESTDPIVMESRIRLIRFGRTGFANIPAGTAFPAEVTYGINNARVGVIKSRFCR